jgi:hypothetical protein
MNAQMNSTGQNEFHLDAEMLNAFAERALSEGERSEVLKHLAACGRCRQVVALARGAAAEDGAAASRPVALRPDDWWRRWRPVWVPTAVVAAFAVASVSVYVRQLEPKGEIAKVQPQIAAQQNAPVSAPAPAEKAEATPPAASAQATPVEKDLRSAPVRRAQNAASRQAVAATAAPAPLATNQLEAARKERGPLLSAAGAPGFAGEGFGAGGLPTIYMPSASAAKKEQELDKQQAATGAVAGRLFPAKASQAASEQVAVSGARESNARIAASAGQLEVRPVPMATFGALQAPRAALAAGAKRAAYLPNGRLAVSITSFGHLMLAIDGTGTLFRSEDSGSAWEPVLQQWTGRAVVVRKQKPPAGSAEAAPAAEATGSISAGADVAPLPGPAFEIVNDKGQVWLSADGKIWVAE